MTDHYKVHKPESIELIDRYRLNFTEGNIIKYILRSPFKGDRVGDLKKALWYAKKLSKYVLVKGKRLDFDIDELDAYLDSHALYVIEADAVFSVIHGNFYYTVTRDPSGKRIPSYEENYIAKLIEIAIEQRENSEKNGKMEESISKHVKSLADPRPIQNMNFEEKTTDWGWQQTWFRDDFNRACYLAEYTGFDTNYQSDKLQSQRLTLCLANKECPMILTRDLAEKLIYYLSNWVGGRLHEKKIKEFNPDWLPPHPLCTLLDLVDEDAKSFLSRLDLIKSEANIEGKDKYYLDSIRYLSFFIRGYGREIEILSKIGGSKEFWQNKYKNYWEKRNQSVRKGKNETT